MAHDDPTLSGTRASVAGGGDTRTFDPGLAQAPRTPAATPAIGPGMRIGRYVIEHQLGAGGMGVVYAAIDLDLDRKVAIKVMRDSGSEAASERRTRLFREARAMAALDHPNVVRVFEVGVTPDGEQPFIAMELVDGAPLGTWAGGKSWRERLQALLGAGRGLAAAHRAGLVHRDVKPDNILVDRSGRARIGDLGLVGAVRGDAGPLEANAALTRAGAILGTPAFMAPEQHRGEPADARSDQFGFCVSAWSILYERHPFDLRDLPHAVLRGAVVPPPLQIAPKWIAALLRTGLAIDPRHRHPSMDSLLDAIERRLHQRRWPRAVGGLTAALATGGLMMTLWPSDDGGAAASVATRICPAPRLPDVYVDAAATGPGNGSAACPFRTLTAALAVSASIRTVHVAAGRYDADHGEVLPLTVRGATTIRGAGADKTVIAGLGWLDPQVDQLPLSRTPLRSTIVIGDHDRDIAVTGVRVDSGRTDITDGSFGIICTRGNLRGFVGAVPPANTRLDHVAIGTGYETGLAITGSAAPRLSGCNLSLSSSTIHDATTGAWQVGCGQWRASAPTALEISDSTIGALRSKAAKPIDTQIGVGVLVWDCANRTSLVRNRFGDADYGVYLVRHTVLAYGIERDPAAPPTLIAHNDFIGLRRYGAFLERATHVSLERNSFRDSAAGIAVFAVPGEAPRVRARHNAFVANRAAVEVLGEGALPRDVELDFGTADDPGQNHFQCNAVEPRPSSAGATIAIQAGIPRGTTLDFAGNRWDHAPPRVQRGTPTRGRVEVALATDGSRAIDLQAASASGEACAAR